MNSKNVNSKNVRIAVTVGAALGVVLVTLLVAVPPKVLLKASMYEVFGMVIPATMFPILYISFFPWYRSPLGRALMTKATGLALLIDISVIYVIWGDDYWLREHVKFFVYTLVLFGLWYQFVVIIKIKVQAVRERRRNDDQQTELDETHA